MTNEERVQSEFGALVSEAALLCRSIDKRIGEDHFGFDADNLNWGHVGTANDIVAKLRAIASQIGADQP